FSSTPPPNTVQVAGVQQNIADVSRFTGSDGRLESAYIRVGQCTTPAAMTGKVAHEVGHTFGLGNCVTAECKPGTSIMAPAVSSGDSCNAMYPNNLAGPTSCDNEAANMAG